MATPHKRRRLATEPQRDGFERLCGLLQARVPLQLKLSPGSAALECIDCNIQPVQVPADLLMRCSLLRDSPEGHITDVDKFITWLKQVWQRALDGEPEGRKCARLSEDDIKAAFALLEAGDFLGDEGGVAQCCQQVYGWLLDSPVVATLPDMQRRHFCDKDATLPFRLLPTLPEHLARRILDLGPLAVLDRLPIGSRDQSVARVTRMACAAYNVWAASLKPYFREHKWTEQDLWAWRSAIAYHADTTLRVSVFSDHEETQRLQDECRGLHVFKMTLFTLDSHKKAEASALPVLPSNLEELMLTMWPRIGVPRRTDWGGLQLPQTLRYLEVDGGSHSRLCLADLQLPQALTSLTLSLDFVSLADAVLPAQLQSLALRGDGDSTNIRLPDGLTSLEVASNKLVIQLLSAQLPVTLRKLTLFHTLEDLKKFSVLQSLTVLTALTVGHMHRNAEGLAAMTLPASLKELDYVILGREIVSSGDQQLQLPADLATLRLSGHFFCDQDSRVDCTQLPKRLLNLDLRNLDLGDSARQALPPCLTSLRVESVKLGSLTLEAVQWPSSLQRLCIDGKRERQLRPSGLPSALKDLTLRYAKVSLQGVALPASMTAMRLDGTTFDGADALAGITWPSNSGLKRLSLDNSTFGSAADLRRAHLPDSITHLSMRGTHLGRPAADLLRLPQRLTTLRLDQARFGERGLRCLTLPPRLKVVSLHDADLGSSGYRGVRFPDTVEVLHLPCTATEETAVAVSEVERHAPSVWPESLRLLVLEQPLLPVLEQVCCQLQDLRELEHLVVLSHEVKEPQVRLWLKRELTVLVAPPEVVPGCPSFPFDHDHFDSWTRAYL